MPRKYQFYSVEIIPLHKQIKIMATGHLIKPQEFLESKLKSQIEKGNNLLNREVSEKKDNPCISEKNHKNKGI